jgi:hypothetical protein
MPSILAALKASGHAKSVLAGAKGQALRLVEEAGVRLALVLTATGPVRRFRRLDAMMDGVEAMTVEEAYYWYAKCASRESPGVGRALRAILAG